jgi:hypothetical protein
MDKQTAQLALAAQAPLSVRSDADYKAELIMQIKRKAHNLRYTKPLFEQWVIQNLQAPHYEADLLQMADAVQLSRMLDRLVLEDESAGLQFRGITATDFFKRAKLGLRLPHHRALEIKEAWTKGGVTDWPGAMAELERFYGQRVAA